ncbi:MAG: polysaccharide biosynthesis tyrosine autokinase [bacterium]
MKKELTLQDYIQLIVRRRWEILISAGGILIITFIFLITRPPIYESTSTFMLESKELSFTEKGMGFTEQTRPLGYYEAVMKSRIFRSRLLNTMLKDTLLKNEEEVNTEQLRLAIQENIRLTTSEYSEFIELKARAHVPVLAFRLAHHATHILKDRCQEIDREELQNAVDFIDHQKEISKKKLEEAERALQEFKKRTNIAVLDEEGGILTKLVNMENQLTSIQTEKELARANLAAYRRRYSQLQGEDAQSLSVKSDPRVQEIRQNIADLQQKRNQAATEQGETDLQVLKLDREIEAQKRKLINEMIQSSPGNGSFSADGDALRWKSIQEKIIEEELKVFILENKERYYRSLIRDFKSSNPRLMEDAIEYMRMTRAQSVAENLYSFLLERGEESKIKAATGSGGIRIIDDPVMPEKAVPSNLARNLVLSLFLGLGLGFGIALVREYMDNTVQTKEDITDHLNLSLMGVIPHFNGFSRSLILPNGRKDKNKQQRYPDKNIHLISDMKPKSPPLESYSSLRSNLNFTAVDRNIESMVISSPNPMEGKTITTANLGISYALLGHKVLIVDADMRKPKLHQLFKIKSKPGIMEHLVENTAFDKIVHDTKIKGLQIIPCGEMPPNPAELIASRRMKELIKSLSQAFDLVIYDSAPILPVTDTVILASRTDGLLLVVKHGFTDKRAIDQVKENLQRSSDVNLLGVVINQMSLGKGYGYYPSYAYYSKGYY